MVLRVLVHRSDVAPKKARTMGEVENYLVCRLFFVNAEKGLFETIQSDPKAMYILTDVISSSLSI